VKDPNQNDKSSEGKRKKKFVETEVEGYIEKQKVGKWGYQEKGDAVGFLTSIYLAESKDPTYAEEVFERSQRVLDRKTHSFVNEQRLFILEQLLNISLRPMKPDDKLQLAQSWIADERISPFFDPKADLDENMRHLRLKIHSFVVKFLIEAKEHEEAKIYAADVRDKDIAFYNLLCKLAETLQEALEMLDRGEVQWDRSKDTFNTLVTLIKTEDDKVTFWEKVVPYTEQIRRDVMVCDGLLHQLFLLRKDCTNFQEKVLEVMEWLDEVDQILLSPWKVLAEPSNMDLNVEEYLMRLLEIKEDTEHKRKESPAQCTFRLVNTALMCFSVAPVCAPEIISEEQLQTLVGMVDSSEAEEEKKGMLKVLRSDNDDDGYSLDTHAPTFRGSYPRLLALVYYLSCKVFEKQHEVSVVCGKGNPECRKGLSEKEILEEFCKCAKLICSDVTDNAGMVLISCGESTPSLKDLYEAMWKTIAWAADQQLDKICFVGDKVGGTVEEKDSASMDGSGGQNQIRRDLENQDNNQNHRRESGNQGHHQNGRSDWGNQGYHQGRGSDWGNQGHNQNGKWERENQGYHQDHGSDWGNQGHHQNGRSGWGNQGHHQNGRWEWENQGYHQDHRPKWLTMRQEFNQK